MNLKMKLINPLLSIFFLFNGLLLVSKSILLKWGIDNKVLFVANIIFFSLSLIAFFMQQKALKNSNANVFIRSVMGGMLIKMFVVIATVIIYRLAAGDQVSKVSVFAAMFLYLVYLGVEVAVITKLNKQKNG